MIKEVNYMMNEAKKKPPGISANRKTIPTDSIEGEENPKGNATHGTQQHPTLPVSDS
jgi:hypothetical protein